MIEKEAEFQLAIWLRQKIIDLIAGVEDAVELNWNDSSPNWLTDTKLDSLIKEAVRRLASVGAVSIKGFASCGAPDHESLAAKSINGTGYWRIVVRGHSAEANWLDYHLNRMELDGVIMDVSVFDFVNLEPCPCRPKSKRNDAAVVEFFGWPSDSRSKIGPIVSAVEILKTARGRSQKHMPRSGVREQLLRGLLLLEATIAPTSAADHIAHKAAGLKGPVLVCGGTLADA